VNRVIGFVTGCALASSLATWPGPGLAATATPAPKASGQSAISTHEAARLAAMRMLAPADEYFGQLKMSILGIKNTIKDMGLRYDINHDIAKQTVSSLALTEGAIRDWEHKYPHDKEVPRAMYFLQRLYAHIVCDEAQIKAKATASWLFADYPQSPQAKVLKKNLAEATPIPSAAPAVSVPSAAPAAAPAVPSPAPTST